MSRLSKLTEVSDSPFRLSTMTCMLSCLCKIAPSDPSDSDDSAGRCKEGCSSPWSSALPYLIFEAATSSFDASGDVTYNKTSSRSFPVELSSPCHHRRTSRTIGSELTSGPPEVISDGRLGSEFDSMLRAWSLWRRVRSSHPASETSSGHRRGVPVSFNRAKIFSALASLPSASSPHSPERSLAHAWLLAAKCAASSHHGWKTLTWVAKKGVMNCRKLSSISGRVARVAPLRSWRLCTGMPKARCLSPCLKNSSSKLLAHILAVSQGLETLERSAVQIMARATRFCCPLKSSACSGVGSKRSTPLAKTSAFAA
mmetsp:Transcript_89757/g.192427  ORF Transcript_89757/g.192427 Transcript_89757/m.192427 type:complete len:313 (+) Transcript_89757:245-1183(+)